MPDIERGDQRDNDVVVVSRKKAVELGLIDDSRLSSDFGSAVSEEGSENGLDQGSEDDNRSLFTLEPNVVRGNSMQPEPAPKAELDKSLDVLDVSSDVSRDHESSEGEQDDLDSQVYEQEQEARNSTDSPRPTTPVASAKNVSLKDQQNKLVNDITKLDNEIEQLETDIETNKNESGETIRDLATKLDEETGERTPLSKEDIENLSPEERSSKADAILQAEIDRKNKKKEKRKALKVAVKKRLIARRELASNFKSQIYEETKYKITGWTPFRVGQIFKSAWKILRPGPGIKPLSKEAFSKAREGKIEAYSGFLDKVRENKELKETYKKTKAKEREANNKLFNINKPIKVITKLVNPFYLWKNVPKATASRFERMKTAFKAKVEGLKAFWKPNVSEQKKPSDGTPVDEQTETASRGKMKGFLDFIKPSNSTLVDRRKASLDAKQKFRENVTINRKSKKVRQGL